jgi:hypothetical protein
MAVLEPECGQSHQRAQMGTIDVWCRAAAPPFEGSSVGGGQGRRDRPWTRLEARDSFSVGAASLAVPVPYQTNWPRLARGFFVAGERDGPAPAALRSAPCRAKRRRCHGDMQLYSVVWQMVNATRSINVMQLNADGALAPYLQQTRYIVDVRSRDKRTYALSTIAKDASSAGRSP